MLDWELYEKMSRGLYLNLGFEKRLLFEKIFHKLGNYKSGVCYPGGNDSHIIIRVPDEGLGIKLYKDNRKKNLELIKFHGGVRQSVYRDNDYIQRVYECGEVDGVMYIKREWIDFPTLKERYNRRDISLGELNLILDDLFLRIIIPLWGEGLVWKDGCLGNLCYGDRLVMIDTDNMYKTVYEIMEGKSYVLRNIARLLNRDAHLDMVYDMGMCVDSGLDFYELKVIWDKYLFEVYNGDIVDGWRDRAKDGYYGFKSRFMELF
jgi:hypothetical protein